VLTEFTTSDTCVPLDHTDTGGTRIGSFSSETNLTAQNAERKCERQGEERRTEKK
jgi:hypothetical protein